MKIQFEPNLNTRKEDLCKEELNKLHAKNAFEGNLYEEFRSEKPDLSWESEQLAKSHGIYLGFDRRHKGPEKHWIYMIRIPFPGGGPISPDQWLALDELSEKYTQDPQRHPSLRLTTRQNIQFHWVRKEWILTIIKTLASLRLKTLNGCGDNARNVLACPLSRHSDIFDANRWAHQVAEYFQLPEAPYMRVFELDPKTFKKPAASFAYGPQLLNRKFKIAFATVHRDPRTGEIVPDNCTEFLTHDAGIAPIVENGKVKKFQIYLGGGQGERNVKPTAAMLAKPFGIVEESQLLPTLDAIVSVHQECGDRQNRFWARLRYGIKKMGMDWYLEQVQKRVPFKIHPPDPHHDCGNLNLHDGWTVQPQNGLLSFGLFIENGRIKNSAENGDLKTLVRELVKKYRPTLMLTPNQNIVLTDIAPDRKKEFETDLAKGGYNQRFGKPFSPLRLHSHACVGLDTCSLAYTESEKFEPLLIEELEKLGWRDFVTTLGLTGCERQCDRPATKAVGLIGSGLNRYQLKLMGTEDGRHQGVPVISPETQKMYLRSIPRERVAPLLDVCFKFYLQNKKSGESFGYFNRRIGMQEVIRHLSEHPVTDELMTQTFPLDTALEESFV